MLRVIWHFAGFTVRELYDDFVFADYIDIDNGFIKHESGLVSVDTSSNKTWRKAKVIMVGPACRHTSPGDIILFPNDKGLPCGEVEWLNHLEKSELTPEQDIVEISNLIKGANVLYLQHFINSDNCIRKDLHEVPKEKALEYKSFLETFINNVYLRGY